jgi:hypothetical protein
VQCEAISDLLVLKSANGGKMKYGDIARVAKDYEGSGDTEVDYRHLHYRLS